MPNQLVSNGPAIKALRLRTGIAQGDFAKRIGVTQGALSHIEKNTYRASDELTRRIADELGVPLDAVTRLVRTTEAVA